MNTPIVGLHLEEILVGCLNMVVRYVFGNIIVMEVGSTVQSELHGGL